MFFMMFTIISSLFFPDNNCLTEYAIVVFKKISYAYIGICIKHDYARFFSLFIKSVF